MKQFFSPAAILFLLAAWLVVPAEVLAQEPDTLNIITWEDSTLARHARGIDQYIGEQGDFFFELKKKKGRYQIIKWNKDFTEEDTLSFPNGQNDIHLESARAWWANEQIHWLVAHRKVGAEEAFFDLYHIDPTQFKVVGHKTIDSTPTEKSKSSKVFPRNYNAPKFRYRISPNGEHILIHETMRDKEEGKLDCRVFDLTGQPVWSEVVTLPEEQIHDYEEISVDVDDEGQVLMLYRVWPDRKLRMKKGPTFTYKLAVFGKSGTPAVHEITQDGQRMNILTLHPAGKGRWFFVGSYSMEGSFFPQGLIILAVDLATGKVTTMTKQAHDFTDHYVAARRDPDKAYPTGSAHVQFFSRLYERPDGGWYACYEVLGYLNSTRIGMPHYDDNGLKRTSSSTKADGEEIIVMSLEPNMDVKQVTVFDKSQVFQVMFNRLSYASRLVGNDLVLVYYEKVIALDLGYQNFRWLTTQRLQPHGKFQTTHTRMKRLKSVAVTKMKPLGDNQLLIYHSIGGYRMWEDVGLSVRGTLNIE